MSIDANGPAPADAATGTGNALRLSNVFFSWAGTDSFSLRIREFNVPTMEKLLLMGPSGSGKTTLLSLICGIAQPQEGQISVVGTDIAKLPGAARDRFRADHFGIIFQMFNLLPYGSVIDNMLLPLNFSTARRRRATANGPARDEAIRMLNQLGLGKDVLDRPAAALSVGQQQRVAVARALIGKPEIVIADEPTSALDRDRRQGFLELLLEEVAQAKATLIMVSHDDSLAAHFDRIAHYDDIEQGK